MRITVILALLTLLILGGFAGCRTEHSSHVKEVGFLTHPELLKKGVEDRATLSYRKPGVDFKKYPKVMLRPTTIWAKPGTDLSEVPKKELQALADSLHKAIHDEVAKVKTIVGQPGPGVLEIRVALTEADGATVALDVVTTVLPQAILLSGAIELATGTRGFAGAAAIEMEVRDSVSKEVLGAAVDRRTGGKTPEGMFSTWDDVHSAFAYWAEKTRKEIQAGKPEKESEAGS